MIALSLIGTIDLSADPVESSLDTTFAKLEETVPGKFSINSVLRYEVFDLANGVPANDRDGTSLRVRYGYTTPDFSGFTAMIEGETLTRVGGDAADIHPLDDAGDGTDLNQLWVQYKNADYGSLKLGRQIYALDDHRFIGHVGWRQNIQVFDAATFDYTAVKKLSIKGFYLAEQHAVNGTHNELDAVGLNATYAFAEGFKLTGFIYDISGEDVGNAGISNQTLGLRATGKVMLGEQAFNYSASIAEQEDTENSPAAFDAGYFAGDLSTKVGGVTVGAGFEILEAGFRTPLATVHKFNGFADALLPLAGFANGLEDYYAYVGYTLPVGNGINAQVIYHEFSPETGAGDYGDEIDFVLSYKFNKYFSALAKYGSYDSNGGSGGVGGFDKDMFTFEVSFAY